MSDRDALVQSVERRLRDRAAGLMRGPEAVPAENIEQAAFLLACAEDLGVAQTRTGEPA